MSKDEPSGGENRKGIVVGLGRGSYALAAMAEMMKELYRLRKLRQTLERVIEDVERRQGGRRFPFYREGCGECGCEAYELYRRALGDES